MSEEPPLWAPKIDRGRTRSWLAIFAKVPKALSECVTAITTMVRNSPHNGGFSGKNIPSLKKKEIPFCLADSERSYESARLLARGDALRICA